MNARMYISHDDKLIICITLLYSCQIWQSRLDYEDKESSAIICTITSRSDTTMNTILNASTFWEIECV